MNIEVSNGIAELKRQFPTSSFQVREDGQGGAYLTIEPVSLGAQFQPEATWIGFHMPPQYPYADIYPVFAGADVCRRDGVGFSPPVTTGHHFEGRTAIQISRRNGAAQGGLQTATGKVLKILDFMEKLQ